MLSEINFNTEEEEFYIHFKSVSICEQFILNNNVEIGHRCCSGKGVLLKSFDNEKIANYDDIKRIERKCNKL